MESRSPSFGRKVVSGFVLGGWLSVTLVFGKEGSRILEFFGNKFQGIRDISVCLLFVMRTISVLLSVKTCINGVERLKKSGLCEMKCESGTQVKKLDKKFRKTTYWLQVTPRITIDQGSIVDV